MDPYATHIAPLVGAALKARGPILELGCGDYSTPVLAQIAAHLGVPFMVMSSDPVWSAKFKAVCTVQIVADWTSVEFPAADVVMLDNEQKTRDRIRLLPALARSSRVVVVHDLEQCEAHDHWKEMSAPFKSIEHHVVHSPGTGILSC